jgi:ParB family chromosome partitioning protein
MKIKLSEIKTKSPRVRQSQDPEKLDELAASITAFGQAIIPVGVRKNGQGYDLVYGHRRVAAAKQAGLKEIEAIEVEAGDDMLKVFGLTENVVREGMSSLDIARALQQIKDESGWTDEKVGKFFGHSNKWVNHHLQLLEPEIERAIGKSPRGDFGAAHLNEVKAGLNTQAKKYAPAVVKKVSDEGLSTRQARHVAELVKDAVNQDGQRGANAILNKPYEDMRPTIPPGRQSEILKSQWSKPKAQDWHVMMNNVEGALRVLDSMVVKLMSSKDGKAVIKKFLPKWISALEKIVKTLKGGL